jgi:hypothetical protein
MRNRLLAAAIAAVPSFATLAQPLTTAFTLQGRLDNAGSPASGVYDFQFALFDGAAGGSQLGTTLCSDNVAVSGGTFTVQLDFGAQFAGNQPYLEVRVRQDTGLSCGSAAGFTTLAPRQNLTAAPNAAFSLNAALLNSQPASFYLNASNVTSGTLPDARLSLNVALLSGAQTFFSANSFTAPTTMSTLNLGGAAGTGLIFAPGTGPLITAGEDNAVGREKRMWIAHSQTYNTWGIQYRDVISDGLPGDAVELVAGDQTHPSFAFTLASKTFRAFDGTGAPTVTINGLSGAANFNGGVTQSYSGSTARATPVAFGCIGQVGGVISGTPNIASAVYNASAQNYEVTLTGENYTTGAYATVVTVITGGQFLVATTEASSGHLVVFIRNTNNNLITSPFSFVTYKP